MRACSTNGFRESRLGSHKAALVGGDDRLDAIPHCRLGLKATLIIAGNPSSDADGIFAVLYLSGIALALAAAIGTGLRRRGVGARIGVAIGLSVLVVAWIMGLGDLLKPVIAVFSDAQRVKDEVPIGIAGVVLLVLAYLGHSRDQKAAIQPVGQERATSSPRSSRTAAQWLATRHCAA